MTKTWKNILALALAGSVLLPGIASAEPWHEPPHHHHGGGDAGAAAAAAGIIGLAAGAIIGSTASHHDAPPPPPPAHSPRPWTGEWYRYCSSKYRSFNPHTGYYHGYDGHQHFCH